MPSTPHESPLPPPKNTDDKNTSPPTPESPGAPTHEVPAPTPTSVPNTPAAPASAVGTPGAHSPDPTAPDTPTHVSGAATYCEPSQIRHAQMINTRIKHADYTRIRYIKNALLKTIIKNTVTATDHENCNNRVGGNDKITMDEEVNDWEIPAYLQRRRRGGHSSPLINHHVATAPIQPTRGTQNIYFEPQEQSRCMIHSYMFVGYRITTSCTTTPLGLEIIRNFNS